MRVNGGTADRRPGGRPAGHPGGAAALALRPGRVQQERPMDRLSGHPPSTPPAAVHSGAQLALSVQVLPQRYSVTAAT
jgi:hypothetical protein